MNHILRIFRTFCVLCLFVSTPIFSEETLTPSLQSSLSPPKIPPPSSAAVFCEINIGLGWLYFSNVEANLGNIPAPLFSMLGSIPEQKDLSYSKAPLFEYLVGYQFNDWFGLGLSYQNQSNIYLQTRVLPSLGGVDSNAVIQFGADIQLNSLGPKLIFETPQPFVWKKIATKMYVAAGTGVSWQTWSNIINRIFQVESGDFVGTDVPFRQKTIPNILALADIGFNFTSSKPNPGFSVNVGCKYNYWGQTRNLGMQGQQSNYKIGLFHPFRIQALYSFAPYLGLHWDFPVTKGLYFKNRSANTEEMFFVPAKLVTLQPCVTAQVNIGPNFLFLSGRSGNLAGEPQSLFFGSGSTIPLEKKIAYTKSPLMEYLIGYRLNHGLEMGISYQYQNETTLISKWLPGQGNETFHKSLNQFKSSLNLNALMAKFSLNTVSGIIKNMAFTPFISAGLGASWQSWTDIKIERTAEINGTFTNNFLYLRSVIIPNFSWMVDSGIKLRNADPQFLFSITAGCRFNYWGSVRNIGKANEQDGLEMGLFKPIGAKILYSFAPYLGMQWDFPVNDNYCISSLPINTWKPFFTNASNIQKKKSVFTQANVGPGILVLDQIEGNIGGNPPSEFEQYGSSPLKGNLSYNITPVYEYLLGYRFNQWLKTALSYQSQKSIFISTQPIEGIGAHNGGDPLSGSRNQFRAQLTIDALMGKCTYEIPYPIIFKGYAFAPYLGVGLGASWQSWTNMRVNRILNAEGAVGLVSMNQSIRQKIIANVSWMAETGFSIRCASFDFPFTGIFGCKYVQLGATRNIGKMDQQAENQRFSLRKPFKMRVLSVVIPYVGLQWNF